VELNEIVQRVASLFPEVDESMTREDVPVTPRWTYIPSLSSAKEPVVVRRLMERWIENHPEELPGIIVDRASKNCPEGCLERPYIEGVYNRGGRADVGITTNTSDSPEEIEWIIEFKKFETIGDSGGKNQSQEGAIAKLLSPWPMTHGLLYDALRILGHPEGARKAIIMYGFSYDNDVVDFARRHPRNEEEMQLGRDCNRSENLSSVLSMNNGVPINFLELVPDFERSCNARGTRLGERCNSHFEGLTTHPIHIQGDIVAWEILES